MIQKPSVVIEVYVKKLAYRQDLTEDGWTWDSLEKGGILKIRHSSENRIKIMKQEGIPGYIGITPHMTFYTI